MDPQIVKKHHSKPKFMNNILDDIFHPCAPVCKVIPTKTEKPKDYFNIYRPKPKTCLDYNISQTDTKLDAGDTKIHYQKTEAEYIPELSELPPSPVKKKFKRKYFSGGPPHWEFIDEIWLKHQLQLQKEYHKQFKIRVKERKGKEKHIMTSDHNHMISLVGPAWFQELSPDQMKTVEKLKDCILKDLADGTIIHTQENIGKLGLVLRPNHRHIKKALKNCCKCPVELLLILYQLINPKRKKYSINDRLLLSAVVHLTMMSTLKELHIRIPSPPPPPKIVKKNPKKKKHVTYDSPYLIPYTFKREPPKFTGIYTDKHLQHPQSPYFCYLDELKKMKEEVNMIKTKNITTESLKGSCRAIPSINEPIDEEIEKEFQLAQSIYAQLVDYSPVPFLLKPSKYIPCDNFRNKPPPEIEEIDEESESLCYYIDEQSCCDAGTEITEELSGNCDYLPQSTCPCASVKSKCDEQTEEKEDLCGDTPTNVCKKKENESDNKCCDQERCRGGCDFESVCMKDTITKTGRELPHYSGRQDLGNARRRRCAPQVIANKRRTCAEMYPVIPRIKRCECKETYMEFIEKPFCPCEKCKEDRRNRGKNYVIAGMKETETKEITRIIDGVTLVKPCRCLEKYEEAVEKYESEKKETDKDPCSCVPQEVESVLELSSSEELDPEKWCFCDRLKSVKRKKKKKKKPCIDTDDEKEPCRHEEGVIVFNTMYQMIRPNKIKKKPCICKEKHREVIDRELCQCEKCKLDRQKKDINYVIAGTKETESREMLPIIDRVVVHKPCDCLKKYEKAVEVFEKDRELTLKRLCDCRKEVTKLMDTPLCPCEKCQEDRRKKAAQFIITGTKEAEENLHVIEGISMGRPCRCIKEYEKRVNKYEAFQKRKQIVTELKELQQKFIISGVHATPQGPVYVISGMRPEIDCICAKKAREEAAEAHMRQVMPEAPRGRVKYNIVGVKETPEKNYYILQSAIPMEECDCMKLYKKYTEQHETCMELYELYLAKMKEDYNEFMADMLVLPTGSRRSSRVSNIDRASVAQKVFEEKEQTEEEIPQPEEQINVVSETNETKSRVSTKAPTPCPSCKKVCSVCTPSTVYCSCGNPYYCVCCECGKRQKVECQTCVCGGQVIECVDCTCGLEEAEEEENKLKRYFIFKKILCSRKWQEKVIREALKSMADDGYPLAKLPECYKLPHFKLWMQMRCKMFWTKRDKYNSVLSSKYLWRHLHCCTIWEDPFPKLKISRSEGRLYDWSKADSVRQIISTAFDKFYRKIKQNRINFGREFFPSTFSYTFPFKTWRDCYFAYTPAKEEEVLARFVWQKYDFKNVADMQRFCG